MVIQTVSPSEAQSATVEGRATVHREALVETAISVIAAANGQPVIAISSLSVHGTGEGHALLTEATPLPALDDPSPRAYREMEARYLAGLPSKVTLLRTGDIVSPGDPTTQQKVAMAHRFLAGSVPFDDRSLAYRCTAEELAEVVVAVLAAGPQGVLHVIPKQRPPTNEFLYGRACERADVAPLTFRRELATPIVEVSASRLAALGLNLQGAPD